MGTPTETRENMIAYGAKKTLLTADRYLIMGFMSGFWLGVAGHISTKAASLFYDIDEYSAAHCNIVYGSLFPVGLMAISFTSCELYTGNTAAMTMYALDARTWKAFGYLVLNWAVVVTMNLVGGVTAAFLFTWCSGAFHEEGQARDYLFSIATKKISYEWYQALVLGIGCNMVVCLTVWTTILADSVIAKLVAIWFIIATFCWGGFEHVIANFYTMTAAAMVGFECNFGFDVIWMNWIPVWLGNTLGGTIFSSMLWYWSLRPYPAKKDEGWVDSESETTDISPV